MVRPHALQPRPARSTRATAQRGLTRRSPDPCARHRFIIKSWRSRLLELVLYITLTLLHHHPLPLSTTKPQAHGPSIYIQNSPAI
jgi:hypothetical protein